jgi:hypothetical protein
VINLEENLKQLLLEKKGNLFYPLFLQWGNSAASSVREICYFFSEGNLHISCVVHRNCVNCQNMLFCSLPTIWRQCFHLRVCFTAQTEQEKDHNSLVESLELLNNRTQELERRIMELSDVRKQQKELIASQISGILDA